MKPFLYLFVLFPWVSIDAITAQEAPIADSLAVVPVDTLVAGKLAGDSIAVDSTAVKPGKEPPFKTRVKYKAADSVKIKIQEQQVYMYKETRVDYEDIELTAHKTQFDMFSKIVYAKGGRDSLGLVMEAPVFKQGGQEYDADSLSYNFDTKKGFIYRVKTHQGEGYLQAAKAKRYADGHLDMGYGIYTTCEADHPHFGLRLRKAKAIPGDQVVFGPAYLELLDIPLYFLALPFGFFPQTNKTAVSGVIPPSIGMEVSRGLSLTNGGYYFAFNDHIDAQLTGDIYSTGTWRSMLTTRYMKRYKFSGNLDMTYGVSVTGEKGLDLSKTKQYSVQWSHRQDPKANPNHTFQASVNYSSSTYDKEFNYMSSNAYYNNSKNSSVSFSQNWPNSPFHFSTNMRINQTSTNGMTTIDFPNFTVSMDRIYPFRKKESVGKPRWYEDIALQYDASMQNTLTGSDDNLFSEKNMKNMRNGFQHRIPFSINFKALKFFNITPSMNYSGALYTSQVKKTFYPDSSLVNSAQKGVLVTDTIRKLSYAHALSPSLSISMTPKFYLMNRYGPNSKVEAIRTVISPTAGISYVPDLSSLFNYYDQYVDANGRVVKYSIYEGQPVSTPSAPGQSGSVSVGINGNVEMKVRSDKDSTGQSRKVKLLNNISATTSYNMFADSMNWNNIALSANTTIWGINLTLSGSADPYKLSPSGTRINQFGPRLTSMSFNTGISLPLEKKERKKEEGKEGATEAYSYFNVPWNVSINYGLSYSKPGFTGNITQTLSLSGNVTLTPKWSLNFSSSYDFKAKKIAYTTATIQRDLHCWQMSMNFSPFGANKFYFFQINVKSTTLRDLKYEKRKSASDFSRNAW
ncbi:MAG: LPS-assembly protein LptD [Bacteroidales bacterium]|nr:LPS-assembly protein LptD [Bacteroidales bacterium]